MKEKKTILRFFNLFDIAALVIIVALAAVLLLVNRASSEPTEAASGTVTYVIQFSDMQNGSEKLIAVGDKLVDKVKKYSIGTVESVEITDALELTENYEDGTMVESAKSTGKDAYVTVTALCTETDSTITVGGGYIVRVGLETSVRGPGYFGSGYIVDIQRGN